jgi:hypothetical protein
MPLEAAVVANIGIVGVVGSVWSLHRARVATVWSRLSRRGSGVRLGYVLPPGYQQESAASSQVIFQRSGSLDEFSSGRRELSIVG